MDGYSGYDWGYFLWSVLFLFLLWRAFVWLPNSWGIRGRQFHRRYGDPEDWSHPYPAEFWRSRGKHRGRGPKGYRRPDTRIEEDINDRLFLNGDLDATEIHVKAENGLPAAGAPW